MNYFKDGEFKCAHCGRLIISEVLRSKLNQAREIYGSPMPIVSGYRCEEYNAQVGGVQSSSHTKGEAADIACMFGRDRLAMMKALLDVGFNRIGVGETFLHVDVSKDLPQDVMWVYGD